MKRFLKYFLIILVTIGCTVLFYHFALNYDIKIVDKSKTKENKQEEKIHKKTLEEKKEEPTEVKEPQTKEFTIEDDFGDGGSITINAIKYVRLSGFAGASDQLFYIDKDYNLIHLRISVKKEEKISSNIVDIEVDQKDPGMVKAYYEKEHTIYKENGNVEYIEKKKAG